MGELSASQRERLFWRYSAGDFDGVIAWFDLQPSTSSLDAELVNLLGLSHARTGDFFAAARAFQIVADLDEQFTDVQFNLALAHWKTGNFRAASRGFRKATDQDPQFLRAWVGLGRALAMTGKTEAAIDALLRAIDIDPTDASIFGELGMLWRRKGEWERAENCLSKAALLAPEDVSVLNTLANTYRAQMRPGKASAAYERALAIDPTHVDTLVNLASLQKETGQLSASLKNLRTALKRAPNDLGVRMAHYECSMDLVDWSVFPMAASLAERSLEDSATLPPFPLLALEDNPAHQLRRSVNWSASRPLTSVESSAPTRTAPGERLRIGYFSADVRQHPAMHLFEGHLRSHDRTRFEVFLFSYGPPDAGDTAARIAHNVEHFFDVHGQSDGSVVELAKDQMLDLAIDLTGYTTHSRTDLFRHRLASVQISYLGYPGSSGAAFMDYVMADPVVIPAASFDFYSEKIIHLPHCYQPNDNRKEIATTRTTRHDFGLPEDAFVFCCFNTIYKITPREFDIWMRCLKQVDGSLLWLLSRHDEVQKNLRDEAQTRGVDPSRLVFAQPLPIEEHLARHKHADLFLDTFIINAHTTASDALWAGLPVLSRIGDQFSARVAASLLSAIGLPELIVQTDQEYEELAIELARNPVALAGLRNRLINHRTTHPLFDTQGHCRALEAAYEAAHERFLSGCAPDHITV